MFVKYSVMNSSNISPYGRNVASIVKLHKADLTSVWAISPEDRL